MVRIVVFVLVGLVGCQKATPDTPPSGSGAERLPPPKQTPGVGEAKSNPTPTQGKMEQIQPPLDLKTPPADAVKTASGLIYKKLVTNNAGEDCRRNDTVLINYTGWRQATGETFFSNRNRGQPMPLNLASTAPGFTEAMQLIKKGEKAMLWVPPNIGYKGAPQGTPETLVYEVEVVDVVPAPAIPPDVAAPPSDAKTLKSGTKYIVLKPGTGKDKARTFDTVTFNYTAWDGEGRQFDSTEMRKRPATVPPFRQAAAMEEVLVSMTEGERVRFWVDADKMQQNGRPLPGMPKGALCYELQVDQIQKATNAPPPVPADVAVPPAKAQKTAKGVSYVVLKSGAGGPKPKPSESVRVHYTGWQADGRMFDSSVIRGEPAEFSLSGVIPGWTDAIPLMSVGDRYRFWIPEDLAYKGSPGRPQGQLTFDVELLEIKQPPAHADSPASPAQNQIAAPPDVKAAPADAKKSPMGVSYKILKAGPMGGQHPKPSDTVKVHYTGWTTDGKMFDSSVTRGQPAEFPLTGVIAGWTDGLPMMAIGDTARFWIPEELAYKGKPGRPQGMLVFDIELLEIKPGQ